MFELFFIHQLKDILYIKMQSKYRLTVARSCFCYLAYLEINHFIMPLLKSLSKFDKKKYPF